VVYRHSDPKRCPRTEARPGAWQGSKPHARSPYPDAGNLFHRTLKPAAQGAGAAWAGFHAFRHYCASALIADGRNIVQVSRWLGHHSPSFTLDVYAHLMDDGVGAALELRTKRTPDNARSSQPRPAESDGAGDLLEHH
jgi:integrase